MTIRTTAVVERGASTNRVVVRKHPAYVCVQCRGSGWTRPDGATCKACGGAGTTRTKPRYSRAKPRPSHEAKPVFIAFRVPTSEAVAIDEAARRCQMDRSMFLRQAAKYFIAKVSSP